MITKANDFPPNALLKSFSEMQANYDKRQKTLEQTPNKSAEQKQLEMQLIEMEKLQAIQSLLLKHPDNYASAALIEYLPIDDFLPVYDSVLTTLLKIDVSTTAWIVFILIRMRNSRLDGILRQSHNHKTTG
jgi:hypothetical protein